MSDKIVSKQEMVAELAKVRDCTKREAGDILEEVFGLIAGYLGSGRGVRLTHVGNLRLRRYDACVAYNPHDRSVAIQVPPRLRVKFTAAAPMQKAVDTLPVD
jgi:nucleoid DNA-binding protein